MNELYQPGNEQNTLNEEKEVYVEIYDESEESNLAKPFRIVKNPSYYDFGPIEYHTNKKEIFLYPSYWPESIRRGYEPRNVSIFC